MKRKQIVITDVDRRRLGTLIDRAMSDGLAGPAAIANLEHELERAVPVDPDECPADVVTMHSTVRLRDLDRQQAGTYTLVYPGEARDETRLSVLSPLGTAILGYRAGDEIEWSAPGFQAHFRVEEVIDQHA